MSLGGGDIPWLGYLSLCQNCPWAVRGWELSWPLNMSAATLYLAWPVVSSLKHRKSELEGGHKKGLADVQIKECRSSPNEAFMSSDCTPKLKLVHLRGSKTKSATLEVMFQSKNEWKSNPNQHTCNFRVQSRLKKRYCPPHVGCSQNMSYFQSSRTAGVNPIGIPHARRKRSPSRSNQGRSLGHARWRSRQPTQHRTAGVQQRLLQRSS